MNLQFKDPMLWAFILYLGKVLAFGMSVQEAVFLVSLIAYRVYQEFNHQKLKELEYERDKETSLKIEKLEHTVERLEASIVQINQAVGVSSIIKRR